MTKILGIGCAHTNEPPQDAGQHEFLSWACLAGAREGLQPESIWSSEAHIFNPDRAVVTLRSQPSGQCSIPA
ncbi:MAG TPA: hypothetical protein VGK54_05675 [Chloroflexota bacterium]